MLGEYGNWSGIERPKSGEGERDEGAEETVGVAQLLGYSNIGNLDGSEG